MNTTTNTTPPASAAPAAPITDTPGTLTRGHSESIPASAGILARLAVPAAVPSAAPLNLYHLKASPHYEYSNCLDENVHDALVAAPDADTARHINPLVCGDPQTVYDEPHAKWGIWPTPDMVIATHIGIALPGIKQGCLISAL